MYFAFDIDQTLSTGYAGSSVQESLAYYRACNICVPENATRYTDFFGLPDVLRVHEALPGAVSGVHFLAQMGEIGYFTVRKSGDPEEQIRIEAITRAWLEEHGFPPGPVTFCQGMAEKLRALSQVKTTASEILLIDDSWRKALNAFKIVQDHAPDDAVRLSHLFTLIAFGATENELPLDAPVRLVALPEWAHIEHQGGIVSWHQ